MGSLGGFICIPDHAHLLKRGRASWLQVHRVVPVELAHGEVPLDLILSDLWVIDADLSLVTQQAMAHINGRCLPGVTGVLLERKAKDGDLLAGDSVEHGGHDTVDKPALLVVIDLDDLLPVVGHFREAIALADVHKIQDVLLETGATKANTSVQEPGADPGVLPHSVSHLRHIGTSGLT
uniref:Uncharacterized protein n=1 Tax=Oryza brachyantha TaxID=4533 RepID=J3LDJ5_ORYBR